MCHFLISAIPNNQKPRAYLKKGFPQDIKSWKNNYALYDLNITDQFTKNICTCISSIVIFICYFRDIFHKIMLEIYIAFVKQTPGFP